MSRGIHLISSITPGCGPLEDKCLPYSIVSGKITSISAFSCHNDYRSFQLVKVPSIKTPFHISKSVSISCAATRRNPDFSRQNKHGFSRNRNRQIQERESSENLEESELLTSKNGPLLSLSSSPKFQATATPGPREKEIVELFRKVQAQLRERAAIKEEKQIEASQGKGKESETVDSLLKLLRKHSGEQGKKRNTGNREFIMDQPEENRSYNEEQNTSFFDSNSIIKDENQEPNTNPYRRPASNFRRNSPVPRVKYQPIYPTEESNSSILAPKGNRKTKVIEPHPELEPEPEPEPEPELESELEPIFSDEHEEVFDEIIVSKTSDVDEAYHEEVAEEPVSTAKTDLTALKLPELRVVAKTRGVKGYSKMKKGELLELLSRDSG